MNVQASVPEARYQRPGEGLPQRGGPGVDLPQRRAVPARALTPRGAVGRAAVHIAAGHPERALERHHS